MFFIVIISHPDEWPNIYTVSFLISLLTFLFQYTGLYTTSDASDKLNDMQTASRADLTRILESCMCLTAINVADFYWNSYQVMTSWVMQRVKERNAGCLVAWHRGHVIITHVCEHNVMGEQALARAP